LGFAAKELGHAANQSRFAANELGQSVPGTSLELQVEVQSDKSMRIVVNEEINTCTVPSRVSF